MWARILNVSLGVWLMAASDVLNYAGGARTNDVIVGALVASFAVIAIWEVTRPARWANVALGAWLIAAGWVLGFEQTAAVNGSVVGVFVVTFGFVRGKVRERFGGGWSALWKKQGSGAERTGGA